jgi:co-chaperonin GroES (HSP10)
MKDLKPCGNYVLLEFFEGKNSIENKTSGGLFLPNEKKEPDYAVVLSVGDAVYLKNVEFKIGDKVFFNEYDAKKIQDFDTDRMFILVQVQNIMASYS